MIVGWGPENFNVPFSKYFNPKFFTGPGAETFFDRAHNMFIEILVTTGLVGELSYLALFATLFWTYHALTKRGEDEHKLGLGLTALTIAYMIHNSFIFDTSANFIVFFTIVSFVTHVAQQGLEAPPAPPERSRGWTGMQLAAAAVLSIGALILIWSTNVVVAEANYASTRAIVASYQGDFPTMVTKFRESIDYNVEGRYEYRDRFAQSLLDISSSTDTSKISGFNDAMLEVVGDLKNNIQENPPDYLPVLYLTRIYSTLGNKDPKSPYNDLALQYGQRALAISPTFVRTYYEIGQAYLNKKDYANAEKSFKTAADLNPDVGLSWWYAGVVDLQLGNNAEGLGYLKQSLANGYQPAETDAQKLLSVYISTGDYADMVPLLKQLTSAYPTKTEYWTQLAVVYSKLGDNTDAIAATRTAMKLNPDDANFQAQAAAFLRSLGAQP